MKEPEEIIEAQMIALLQAASPAIDVIGALSPVPEGEQKISPDTYISVFVDQQQPRTSYRSAVIPCDYAVRITVHYALADDVTGTDFRDACRTVRGVLTCLGGDGCNALTVPGFACDDFSLRSTATALDQNAEVGGIAKTYTATVTGRFNNKET